MRARIEAANTEIYAQMAASIRAHRADEVLGLSPELFVRVMHALIDGLMFLHAMTPDLVDARVVRAAFAALLTAESKNVLF
jgi:hypothetical protein